MTAPHGVVSVTRRSLRKVWVMSTPTLIPASGNASTTSIVSLIPAMSLSGIVRAGVDVRLRLWGGVTTSDSRQVKVTDAPAAEIWLILRLDETPLHHRLLGTEPSSSRAPEPALRSPASPR